MTELSEYPKITIVTSNYNGARFLERAMKSVLDQNYPNLEYIVIDAGSTDGSQKIIEKYESRLAYWVSEKDDGFAFGYNKGFARATGDLQAWLNADDLYCPWAFDTVRRCFQDVPEMEWLTSSFPIQHDGDNDFVSTQAALPFDRSLFFGKYYGLVTGSIQQESTFWRRGLWERTGGKLDESLKQAIDAELWIRFFAVADLYSVNTPLGGFRIHTTSKSQAQSEEYWQLFLDVHDRYNKKTGYRDPWRVKILNRTTRRLINYFPNGAVPKSLLFTGKTVQWDFKQHRYVARDTRVVF